MLTTRIERIIAKGQLVPLVFSQTVTASQSDVQVLPVGVVMPFAGEIVAATYKLSNSKTAGTMTVGPTINGTEVSALTVTAANSATTGRKSVKRRTSVFPAGAEIGAEITTDGSFAAGTTPVLTMVVWVVLSLEGI